MLAEGVLLIHGAGIKQKQPRKTEAVICMLINGSTRLPVLRSNGALDLVGTEASGTNMHMARSTVNNSLNALDVGLHRTIGTSMGVRDIVTESHALAADIALCHLLHLLAVKIFVWRPKDAPTS